jgi:diadenosine tetraphosphate (Ap4A) HIT family hydrolase
MDKKGKKSLKERSGEDRRKFKERRSGNDRRCWMCDEKQYTKHLIEPPGNHYVVVPKGYLVEGHILIVLKSHVEWNDAEDKDLAELNKAVAKWRNILQGEYGANVFQTCLCDKDPHLHYHLIPTKGKLWQGKGRIWLGMQETEAVLDTKKIDQDTIKKIVDELKNAWKKAYPDDQVR